ncbi:MAG: hypothetical protein GXP29_03810 [Planctomycetes bacterium]|nr:hypothetical protein [Planctomycetota bacterium]
MGNAITKPNHRPAFEVEAERVLRSLRGAFGELFDSLPEPAVKPQQIAQALGIDKKLAWRVLKIVQSPDPFAAAQYVPGIAAIKTFTDSATRIATPKSLVDGLHRAYADFEGLIRAHAGDRASLEMMLTACAKDDRTTADIAHRRMAFRGNSFIWGAQAKTQLKTVFVRPGDDPNLIHLAMVNGFFKLRQLRDDAPLTVARIRYSDGDGVVRRPAEFCPIDPNSKEERGISLLRDFCSDPLPEVCTVNADAGFVNCELVGNGVGDMAAITCVEGNVARNVASRYRDKNNTLGENGAHICIPCEVLVLDVLIREDTFGLITPEAVVYGELLRGVPYPAPNRERDLLTIQESVAYLGKGPAVLHSSDVPKYPKLARYVFNQLGWDGERFDVYRFRMEYPVVPSTAVLRFKLPEPPL